MVTFLLIFSLFEYLISCCIFLLPDVCEDISFRSILSFSYKTVAFASFTLAIFDIYKKTGFLFELFFPFCGFREWWWGFFKASYDTM